MCCSVLQQFYTCDATNAERLRSHICTTVYNCSCLRSVRLAAWRRYDAMSAPADSSQAADEELAEPSLVRTSANDQVPCHLLRDMTCVAVCCRVLQRNARLLLQHTATHGNTRQHTATYGNTCNTLQHTAPHCTSLQHTATHCNTLQHTAAHCSTLQHTATHCNTLQHTATHCSTLQRTATHCNTLQHTATHCNTLQHTAAHRVCLAVRHDAVACVMRCVS